jgi:hypothetical protein
MYLDNIILNEPGTEIQIAWSHLWNLKKIDLIEVE